MREGEGTSGEGRRIAKPVSLRLWDPNDRCPGPTPPERHSSPAHWTRVSPRTGLAGAVRHGPRGVLVVRPDYRGGPDTPSTLPWVLQDTTV